MLRNIKIEILFLLLVSCGLSSAFSSTVADPCAGPAALLALSNRPTLADSACVLPLGRVILELGGQYQNLKGGGQGYNIPEAELRFGLAGRNELSITVPNYNHQTISPKAGFSSSIIGLKHELGYNKNWLASIEGLFTLPSGSAGFGSDGLGAALNGILEYSFDTSLSLSFMLGLSSQTLPYLLGGQRFNSINPDLVLAWQFNDTFQMYGELYGQSKTAPGMGAGFNVDAGLQYLLTRSIETDFELGQRISGNLGQFNNYIGAGLVFLY